MLHRVVGVGILHFILAATEAYMRIMRPKNDPSNPMLVASVPLAVLDSIICWWIFTSLVQTTRTLRLRRLVIKFIIYSVATIICISIIIFLFFF
jgi:Co/Zn/Cd efflux system component